MAPKSAFSKLGGYPPLGSRRGLLAAACAAPALAACAEVARLGPPPVTGQEAPPILGIDNARFWADGAVEPWIREARLASTRRRAALGDPRVPPPADFLAFSGGGDFGAFGAGLMIGWTAAGTRPEFEVVTGISTGALIAPFAFLGPAYDPQLREVFTAISPPDVLVLGSILTSLLFRVAIADDSPPYRLISRHADHSMLEAIAREYARGRLLLIGTTNLDARRPVVWNIGAIAASGDPRALELFRRILLASASIPGASHRC